MSNVEFSNLSDFVEGNSSYLILCVPEWINLLKFRTGGNKILISCLLFHKALSVTPIFLFFLYSFVFCHEVFTSKRGRCLRPVGAGGIGSVLISILTVFLIFSYCIELAFVCNSLFFFFSSSSFVSFSIDFLYSVFMDASHSSSPSACFSWRYVRTTQSWSIVSSGVANTCLVTFSLARVFWGISLSDKIVDLRSTVILRLGPWLTVGATVWSDVRARCSVQMNRQTPDFFSVTNRLPLSAGWVLL